MNAEELEIAVLEIERAIAKLDPHSSPGTDGLTSNSYKTQRDVFIPFLTELFNNIYEKKLCSSFI